MNIYWYNGRKNVIGSSVRRLRVGAKLTQRELAERLQLAGYDFERLTIGRIETGDRFVADYEVRALADVFCVSTDELFQR